MSARSRSSPWPKAAWWVMVCGAVLVGSGGVAAVRPDRLGDRADARARAKAEDQPVTPTGLPPIDPTPYGQPIAVGSPLPRATLSPSAITLANSYALVPLPQPEPPFRTGETLLGFTRDGSRMVTQAEGRNWVRRVFDGATIADLGVASTSFGAHPVSPDGQVLASANEGAEGHVVLRSLVDGRRLREHRGGQQIRGMDFIADGTRIAALRGDERLTIWDLASGRLEQDAPSQASILAVRPDGAQIALGGRGVVRLLDLAGAETRRYSVGMGEEIAGLAYSPDGSSLAVFARVGSLDFERMRFNVQVWRDAVRVGSFSCWMRPYFPTAAWSADGRWLAYIARSVEHRGDEAWLWSAESGATRLVTSVETSQIFQLDWAPAAPILAYDLLRNDLGTGATFLFDAASHRELARFDDGMGPRFVPDGSRLLVGGGGILDVRMREYAVDPKATPPTPTVATPSPVPTTATPTPPSATPTRTTATHTPTPTGPANPDLLLPSLLAGAPLR